MWAYQIVTIARTRMQSSLAITGNGLNLLDYETELLSVLFTSEKILSKI